MTNVALIGAGDLGLQVLDILRKSEKYNCVGFYDDTKAVGSETSGIKILGGIDDVVNGFHSKSFDRICLCIGYKHLKFKLGLEQKLKNIPKCSIIHPSAQIDSAAVVGDGCIIYADAYIGPNCIVQEGAVLNVSCKLSHDIYVGESSFLSVGVISGGFSIIGKGVFLGIGTIVSDNVKIPDGTVVGASSLVIKSLDKPGYYRGIPAKIQEI